VAAAVTTPLGVPRQDRWSPEPGIARQVGTEQLGVPETRTTSRFRRGRRCTRGRVGDDRGRQIGVSRFERSEDGGPPRFHLETKGNEVLLRPTSRRLVVTGGPAGHRRPAARLLGPRRNGVDHLPTFASKNGDPAAWLGGQPQGGAPDVQAPAQLGRSWDACGSCGAGQRYDGHATCFCPVAAGVAPPAGPPSPESTQAFEPPPGSGIYAADGWCGRG